LVEGFITATSAGRVRTKDMTHKITWSYLWDSILTFQMKYNLLLDFTPNDYFTAKRIKELYYYFQKETHLSDTRTMQPTFPKDTPEPIKILSQFEGYGEETAKKVLQKFGTLRTYFSVSLKERETVSGIGPRKSEEIDKVLDMEVKNGNK